MTDWRTYRRIIDAYRMKLMEVDLAACDQVDYRMSQSKETKWVCDDRPFSPDDLMSASEIAERFGLKVYDIRNWAARNPDQIPAHKEGRRVFYRLGDVLKLHSNH